MTLDHKTNNFTEGWHGGTSDRVPKHKNNLNACIDALATERNRQRTRYIQASTGVVVHATKGKQLRELKRVQTNCQEWGQKAPIPYLEAFGSMELPMPADDRKPEPTTPTVAGDETTEEGDMFN